MPRTNCRKRCFRWNGPFGIGFKRIICGDYFPTQPSFHGCIPLLQCAQAGPNYLTGRCIGSGADQPVDVAVLLPGQTECTLFAR